MNPNDQPQTPPQSTPAAADQAAPATSTTQASADSAPDPADSVLLEVAEAAEQSVELSPDPAPVAEAPPQETVSKDRLRFMCIQVPMRTTDGYAPTSFGANLTGKAAQALADLVAGYASADHPDVDHNIALNRLLESLHDA